MEPRPFPCLSFLVSRVYLVNWTCGCLPGVQLCLPGADSRHCANSQPRGTWEPAFLSVGPDAPIGPGLSPGHRWAHCGFSSSGQRLDPRHHGGLLLCLPVLLVGRPLAGIPVGLVSSGRSVGEPLAAGALSPQRNAGPCPGCWAPLPLSHSQ